ncbi:MAG TPA: cell surface protein SprA [Ferruginibacter sp.]|nr:cell surface protein SprA [Ferruginibacter sp.]
MLLKSKLNFKGVVFSSTLLLIIILVIIGMPVAAQNLTTPLADTTSPNYNDSLRFPIHDRRGDFISDNKTSTYDFSQPSNINDSIAYDAKTQLYTVYEKIGDKYYRTPVTYTFDEYWKMRDQQSQDDYFQQRGKILTLLNDKDAAPKLNMYDNLFNRLFGNTKTSIVPQGNVDVLAGYKGQNIQNPALPVDARKTGGPDFDMSAQVNVNASIGDKLKFPINYNTLANFGQDNQLKLDYTGTDDEIIKRFEAGDVKFTLPTTFIQGSQQLFGIKTQLQFGKLFITGVLANQKSQQQSVNLQGGAALQSINIKADAYDENRHFLLAQYFRANYNKVMANLPAVTTPIHILHMEVWVTNRVGSTVNTRDVVGLMDLGESSPYLSSVNVLSNFPPASNGVNPPSNNTNDLYSKVIGNPNNRQPALVVNNLQNMGLTQVQDFEHTFARKLDSTQYTYNPQVGYLSLSSPLQPNDVLAVAYQYSYNGQIYQVGELSTDVPPDTTNGISQVLFLKLLKATSQRTNLPIWKLMMKNVYSIGYGTLSPTDFNLNVLYQEPSLGTKTYVPFGDKNQGAPIISLVNLDRLNKQLDPQPDGIFDYVEGYTVISQYSRIVFPVLEPFGRDLASQIYNVVPSTAKDSLFYALYDSVKVVAQQYPNLDRFVLQGSAHTTGSSDISIGYNIPRGSVTVTAGGATLVENSDYTINYDLGTIKIINQAILNAGIPVQVNFENNASFGIQQKNYLGLRLDYKLLNSLNTQLALGGTIVRLGEKPFFTKVNYGEDPIRNTMYGLDATYHQNMPRLTKLLNKLPNYSSKAPSSITAYGEGAYLKPGHAPQIGKGAAGSVDIDDFEGSQSGIDLRFPSTSWALASTPYNSTDANGNVLFPEAALNDDIRYGENRAKIAWYQIDPTLQISTGGSIITDPVELNDPRVRAVFQQELFPQITTDFGQGQLTTFDLAYYPQTKGPYNYSADAANVDGNNNLKNPATRWGGLMRSIDQTDFETANIEFIEFWMQDPFIKNRTSAGGKLYFNLGNISEDVLKDGKRFYENGLPTPSIPAQVDTSVWGRIPLNPIQVTNAFSNDPNDRPYQDVGFDGLSDDSERVWRQSYLSQLSTVVTNPAALAAVQKDPSLDDYLNYEDPSIPAGTGILARYRNFNGPDGNSPVNTGNSTTAATLYPDAEDLDKDNTLNQDEEYFQYAVDLKQPTDPEMVIGSNFIVDKKTVTVAADDSTEIWYQFRIPITSYQSKVGNLPDFSSIRFMRMFLTGFADSQVVVRFGELQLTRNSWRNFQYVIDSTGNYTPITTAATFNVGVVSILNDDKRVPFPYRTPKDIQRQQLQSANGVVLLQNEQSMSLQICGLAQNDARGVFQTFPNLDMRQYANLAMYIHAEADPSDLTLSDKDLTAVIRIGSDFVNNYYQIRIPLYLTPSIASTLNPDTDEYNDTLWRAINSLNVDLGVLPNLKQTRNLTDTPATRLYSQLQPNGQTYSIIGNPNLGAVAGILISVENTNAATACGQIWVDELRLSDINEHGAWAAMGRVNMVLSDLGTVTASVAHHSVGFGTIEQNANQRDKDDLTQFDVSTNLELGKLLPKKTAVSIPVYASYSESVSKPEYDPYNLDIKLNTELAAAGSGVKRDSIKNSAIDFTSTTTVNFTNVHKIKAPNKKPRIYDISNFDISYSYVNIVAHNPIVQSNQITRNRGGLGYNFAVAPKYIEPFKKMKFFQKTRGHWFDLIKDFNFNPTPSQISFKADIQEQFGAMQQRSIGTNLYNIPETYDNYFTFERDYLVRWSLARSINFDLNAVNNSTIDEPYGRADTKAKKDTIWQNLFSGGRNTMYNQTTNFSYTLPTLKFPLISWTTVNLKYQATYSWIGASRLALNLGNILENGQQEEATVQLDFNKLYNRFKFFRAINLPRPANPDKNIRTRTDTVFRKITVNGIRQKEIERLKVVTVENPNALPDVGTFGRVVGHLLTSIKQVSVSFSENANTRLPGYTDSTQFVGQNWHSMEPGLGFILGAQPDTNWLNNAAKKGLISRDSTVSDLFQQTYNQRLSISAQVQPIKDFTINLSFSKTLNKNYSELFKDTTGTGNNFGHLSPYGGGGYDISYTSFKTLFGKFDPNTVSSTFLKFQDDRLIISQRVGTANKYNINGVGGASTTPDASGYYYGYGRYSTDVLIPAFIAAYSGQDPHKISLISQENPNIKYNPFHGIIPRPNWKFSYSGLSKIKPLKKIFTNITITHGYSGTLSLDGFTSALNYQDVSRYNYPSFYDTTSKNYVPYFLVPNITMQESFSPLIGIDVTLVNKLQAKFEYSKQRTLSLSLSDYQLAETRSTSYSIGAGYRKRGIKLLAGLKLPKILNKKGGTKLDNEMNFRFDLKVVDNVSSNSVLDAGTSYATSGSKEITLSPTVDYTLSNRVNVKLYFQRIRVIPYISSSVPTTNTKAGIEIRISLAP